MHSPCSNDVGPISVPSTPTSPAFTVDNGTAIDFPDASSPGPFAAVFLCAARDSCGIWRFWRSREQGVDAGPLPYDQECVLFGFPREAGTYPQAGSVINYVPANSLDTPPTPSASGSIAITTFVPGVRIAGSVDVTLETGGEIKGNFDVPFCTASCQAL